MSKLLYFSALAEHSAEQLTKSREQWTAFLTTVARLYKYPYYDQLLIHAQRPQATACAEYDFWRDRMNRYVKHGSHGIRAHRCIGNETPASLCIRRGRYGRAGRFQTCAAVEDGGSAQEADRGGAGVPVRNGCRAWTCTTDQHDHGQACILRVNRSSFTDK